MRGKSMSRANGENRQWRDGLTAMAVLFAKYILAIISGIVTITGFIPLVAENPARTFIKEHPYPIYIVLIITALILLAALNYVRILRREIAQMQATEERTGAPHASAHDLQFFADVLSDVPTDGHVITWLKRANMTRLSPADFPADVLSALDKTAARPRMAAIGFDDQSVANALYAFLTAIDDFRATVEGWTLIYHNTRWQGASANTESKTGDSANEMLVASHRKLIHAYDAFIVMAHAHGIDADATR
jgi:hypothetical protein